MHGYRRSMRRILGAVTWGIVGAVLAAGLIGASFALAGTSLTDPATAVRVVGPPLRADTSGRHEPDPTPVAARSGPPDGTPAADDPSTAPAVTVRSPTPTVPAEADDGGSERGDD